MDIKIKLEENLSQYTNVKNIKDSGDGWLEFDCDGAFNEVFPILSSLLNYHKKEHMRVKGEIVKYKY